MGLFSMPVSVDSSARALVLPAPVRPPRALPPAYSGTLRPKPGGGFSEEHDVRPYRQGDPVRMMHWKLTAKRGHPIVREALEPPRLNRLIRCAAWKDAGERDLILGRLRWMSDYLIGQSCPHYVKIEGRGEAAKITRPGDLTEYLYKALDSTFSMIPASPPARFTWIFDIDAGSGKEASR